MHRPLDTVTNVPKVPASVASKPLLNVPLASSGLTSFRLGEGRRGSGSGGARQGRMFEIGLFAWLRCVFARCDVRCDVRCEMCYVLPC